MARVMHPLATAIPAHSLLQARSHNADNNASSTSSAPANPMTSPSIICFSYTANTVLAGAKEMRRPSRDAAASNKCVDKQRQNTIHTGSHACTALHAPATSRARPPAYIV